MTVTCAYLFGDAERSCRIVRGPARTVKHWDEEWIHAFEPGDIMFTFFKLSDLLVGPGGYRAPDIWVEVDA